MSRPEKPRLHCRNTRLEPLCCFSYAELLEIAKDQNLLILLRKSSNGAANRACCFYAGKRLVRRLIRRYHGVWIVAGYLKPSPMLLPPIELQYFIDSHAHHPCPKARFRPECRQMSPNFQKDLLKKVLRVGCVPHHRADASF